MNNRGFVSSILITILIVFIAAVAYLLLSKNLPSFNNRQTNFEQGELIQISFRVDALEADELELVFPVFWAEYRMEPVKMEKHGNMFEARVNLPKNSLITYQYLWSGKPVEYREQFKKDFEVNRMIQVVSEMIVTDKIYAWGPKEVPRPTRLSGKVTDKQTGQPVLDAVIVADGVFTLASGDGSYEVYTRGGQHQVIAYLLDGSYKTQSKVIELGQGALNFELERAKPAQVKIKINTNPPPYHKVRLYSTTEQTGPRFLYNNRFLTESYKTIEKGEITLDLYEDQYVDYLYSVGNPAISYENKDGQHVVRHFVAKDGLVINDKVGDFVGKDAVTLTVKVPEYTDPKDIIGIGSLHPTLLYMHPKEGNSWTLTLNSSDNLQGQKYRYFKSFDGDGDEETQKRTVTSRVMNDTVSSWKHQGSQIKAATVTVPEIKHKFDMFAYPYDSYDSTIAMLMQSEIARISQKGFHGLVLSQIWGYEALEPKAKITKQAATLYMPFFELKRLSKLAHEKDLKVTLFPQLVGAESVLSNPRVFDEKWWDAWLDEIEEFNRYNARTGQEAGVDYLLLQTRQPGLEMPAAYLQTYNKRLKEIITGMRAVYKGKIIVPVEEEEGLDYWKEADIVSQKLWDSLGLSKDASQQEIDLAVANLLDTRYKPIFEKSRKPFLIDQLAYESTDGAVNGTQVPEGDGAQTDNNHSYPLDVEEQRMIHEAYYKAINERNWISGVYLFGYGFTDKPLAREIDIRGKPAEDLASAWARKIREK